MVPDIQEFLIWDIEVGCWGKLLNKNLENMHFSIWQDAIYKITGLLWWTWG